MADDWKNQLYFGDNLEILRKHIPTESIDLIYLDPPFNSSATYNILFGEKTGEKSAAQITAFEDTWQWGQESAETFHEMVTTGPKKLADLLQALHSFLGSNNMMAYLTMMAIRLVELHRVLKVTGSLYLHCDPTASHYIKILMDAIFGKTNFRNEIIWSYKRYTASSKRFQRLHDVILFYSKSNDFVFNDFREEYGPKSGKADSHYKQDEDGNWYRWQKRKGQDPYKIYLSEGKRLGDVWDIPLINASARERLGYPTQKPEDLLERIILASSNEGDVLLDPFCGCGTAVVIAERLKRRWIGIDITHLAITLIKKRFHDAFEQDLSPYQVIGEPTDLKGAGALAQTNRHQFEWWALGLVDARPAQDKKKGADTGIDGYIYFFDDNSGKAKKIIVQVKSGHATASQIRDLKGVLDREKAVIGVFITLQDPTGPMKKEATSSGFYEPDYFPGMHFPRLQIFTIEELLAGQQVGYPHLAPAETFKKAERKQKGPSPKDKQGKLGI